MSPLVVEPPASAEEVEEVERALNRPLPESFRRVLLGFARRFEIDWRLPDDDASPLPDVFGGRVGWSLAELVPLERARMDWVTGCFSDPANAYDRVWHDKLAILHVPNGDLVALDPRRDRAPCIYLSHEDGPGHGTALGADFEDAIDRLAAIGFVGPEDWQWMAFVADRTTGIDVGGESARTWRAWLGLSEP